MDYFLRFMGWLILYSLLYFVSLDIMGFPPGNEVTTFQKIFNFGVIPAVSIPLWLLTWRWFATAFGAKDPVRSDSGATEYSFALRLPALKYYLMTLKLFLLAMGANGIIALNYHEGGARVFYICNFIVLYLYAIPFFVVHARKLAKAVSSKLALDDQRLRLVHNGETITEIHLEAIHAVAVEESVLGLLIEGSEDRIYLGGQRAKGSGFFLEGVDEVFAKLKQATPKIHTVKAIKDELKKAGFKPYV